MNKIYVVNKYLKEAKFKQLKEENSSNLNFKVLTMEELIDTLSYTKTDKALEYIYTNKNYGNKNYSLSKMLLNNACNLYDNLSNINEIENLIKLREDLISKKLISKNIYKIKSLQNSELYIQNYLYTDKIKKLLDDNNIKSFLLNSKPNDKKLDLEIYDNYTFEISDVVNQIASLLDKKVPTNKIVLVVNPGKEMEAINLLKNCNINAYFDDIDILNQDIVHKTILKLKEDFASGNEYIDSIKTPSKISVLIKNVLVSAYSKCISNYQDNDLRLDSFKQEVSKNKILTDAIGILVTSSLERINMFEHVFITYFDEKYPIKSTNNDYLLDSTKEKYSYLNPSYITSKIEKEELLDLFYNIKNLHLSRSNIDFTKDSINLSDYESYSSERFNIIKYNQQDEIRYSKQNVSSTFALLNQLYTQYGFVSDYYVYLYKNKDKFDYKKYNLDNINIKLEDSSILNNKTLSFSSLSTYATCPFKYLLEKIFRIDGNSDKTNLHIGTICHKLLELYSSNYSENDNSYLSNFVNEYTDKYDQILKECQIDENELTIVQKFYYKKSYLTCLEIMSDFDNFLKTFGFTNLKPEFKFSNQEDDTSTKLEYIDSYLKDKKIVGTIDLICTNNKHGNSKYFLVDFKTGSHPFNKEKCECGIDMQLAFYTYSLSLIDSFKKDNIMGFAYYQVPFKNYLYKINRDSECRINGLYFNKDMYIDCQEDEIKKTYIPDLTNSRTSCVFKDGNQLLQFYSQINQILVTLIKKVESNNFNVTKTFVKKEDQCQYCRFKDCCYVNISDKNQVNQIGKYDEDADDQEE